MSFIGRIISGARDIALGGPIGALIELAARQAVAWLPAAIRGAGGDGGPRSDPRHSIAFTIAVIALGAKMAKADGTVTRDEVAAFREAFSLPAAEDDHLRLVFDLARKSIAGFEGYAKQVARLFHDDRSTLEDLLAGLFHIALADGRLCPAEDAYLREVARLFGFTPQDYTRFRAEHLGQPVEEESLDPHAVLGVPPDAMPEQIRHAYRQLMRENHPDLVSGRGLPEQAVRLATARVARINTAYDRLARHLPRAHPPGGAAPAGGGA